VYVAGILYNPPFYITASCFTKQRCFVIQRVDDKVD
jgi:hypothetical protein